VGAGGGGSIEIKRCRGEVEEKSQKQKEEKNAAASGQRKKVKLFEVPLAIYQSGRSFLWGTINGRYSASRPRNRAEEKIWLRGERQWR
jgi:hypothetical protein